MNTDPKLLDRLRGDDTIARLLGGVQHLLLGCSSGGDSLCLLDLLAAAAPAYRVRLTVAHLNHGLRGQESEAEASRVAETAGRYGLPFVTDKAELLDTVGDLESRARRARLQFFRRCCESHAADAVALAHTLDDRVETVLMNLARGAGRRGLRGMRERSRVDGLLVLRPLLRLRRQELRDHLRGRGIQWHEDPMNEDLRFTRVRLRREVIPALAAAVPGAVPSIARAAEILEAEEDWISDLVEQRLAALSLPDEFPGGLGIAATELRAEHPALQARLLRAAIARVRGDLQGIRREHVEALLGPVLSGAERARDLPGVRALRQGDTLRLLPLQGRMLGPADVEETER